MGGRPRLYSELLMTLHFQLKQCPRDFFVDIVTRNNFLTVTLAGLFENVDAEDAAPTALKQRAAKFQRYLTKAFNWKFDNDMPVVVVDQQSSTSS